MAVLPFFVAGAVLAWDRWVRRRREPGSPAAIPREVLLLSFLGVVLHTPMDWLNTYGSRFWLPFSGGWSYGDAVFIVDPWLWLLLGSAVFLARAGSAALWAILAVAITALMLLGPVPRGAALVWGVGLAAALVLRRWSRLEDATARRGAARMAVAAAAVYIALMVSVSGLGRRHVEQAAAAAGLSPVDILVSPAAANPFAAEVEVVTAAGYVPGELRWLPRPTVTLRADDLVPFLRHAEGLDSASVASVVEASRALPDARHYLIWSRYPHAEVRRVGATWEVRWSDARYDGQRGAGGLSGVVVDVPAAQ